MKKMIPVSIGVSVDASEIVMVADYDKISKDQITTGCTNNTIINTITTKDKQPRSIIMTKAGIGIICATKPKTLLDRINGETNTEEE